MPTTAKILLVDDEARMLDLLALMLMELGWDTATATRPDDALRLAKEERFHMAIVDNMLGSLHGIDLIDRLRQVDPELPCVLMTGKPNIDLAVASLKRGVADFLRKPFRTEDLLVSIDHVTRRREVEQKRKELVRGLERAVREKTEELNETYLAVLAALSRTVEKRDLGTYGHSTRVSELSVRIAGTLGLSSREAETVRTAALLHDIGKIGISDHVLGKAEPLTEEERRLIRSHPAKGVEILQPLRQFGNLLPAILHHHERYDGSGYPAGLTEKAIPLEARIIAVADAYDAICSDRPYRPAASHHDALREIEGGSGRQFDPAVAASFLQCMQTECVPEPVRKKVSPEISNAPDTGATHTAERAGGSSLPGGNGTIYQLRLTTE